MSVGKQTSDFETKLIDNIMFLLLPIVTVRYCQNESHES